MKISLFGFFILISFFSLTLSSCSKEKCEDIEDGPTYELEDESKEYVENYFDSFDGSNSGKIVFKNTNNEEFVFNVGIIERQSPYSRSIPCEDDPNKSSPQNGVSELIRIALDAVEYEQSIMIRLIANPGVDPAIEEPDALFVAYGDSDSTILEWDPLLIHYNDANLNFSIIKDSLILNGEIYYDVIEVNPANPGFEEPFDPPFEVKYTKELGIIYLYDKINDRELFYDRIE